MGEKREGIVLVPVKTCFEGGEGCWGEGFWRYGRRGHGAGVANCRCLRRPVYRRGGCSFGHFEGFAGFGVVSAFGILDVGRHDLVRRRCISKV